MIGAPVWLQRGVDQGDGYPLIAVPVPGLSGTLYAGPIPGRGFDGLAGEHLDLLVAAGVTRVLCLVPESSIGVGGGPPGYDAEARLRFGERFHVLPIPDFGLPPDAQAFGQAIALVRGALGAGEHVLVHCVAGCGRTGLFVACLLVGQGLSAEDAIRHFEYYRGCGPETEAQVGWIAGFEVDKPR